MVMTYPPDYGDDGLDDAVNLINFLELEGERPDDLADRCRKVAEIVKHRRTTRWLCIMLRKVLRRNGYLIFPVSNPLSNNFETWGDLAEASNTI